MKEEKLFDAITDVDEDLLACALEPQSGQKRSRKRLRLTALLAATLAVAIFCGILFLPEKSPLITNVYAIAEADYPKMAQSPDIEAILKQVYETGREEEWTQEEQDALMAQGEAWEKDRLAQLAYADMYAVDELEGFLRKTISHMLTGAGSENRIYSPLNVYIALAMLAEVTDGNSRAQILSLLGAESMEALRTQANAVWNANYCNDGATKSLLASSLWLNENITFVQETMNRLASNYYASSYQGKTGSAEFDKALQNWMNEQTGAMLEEQTGKLRLDEDTRLALVTTLSFLDKWMQEFAQEDNTNAYFYGTNGDLSCDFMNESENGDYYWSERFGAVCKSFHDGKKIWFILPDEGTSVETLVADGQVTDFILANGTWENKKFLKINLSVPKFDISSELDLKKELQALGVTDVFDMDASDFSPMTTQERALYLSQATHSMRVAIDEEGCTASATMVSLITYGASEPEKDEIDFVLDRPFLFAVTDKDGLPLFLGIVNNPID